MPTPAARATSSRLVAAPLLAKLAFAEHRAKDDVAIVRLYYRGMQMKGELTVEPFDADAVLRTPVALSARYRS